jgi:diguanylate cyclase (GGDEF)-like protein
MNSAVLNAFSSTGAIENKQLLNRIFMIAERMIVFDGLDDVFEHIVRTAVSLTNADAATIRVFDIETGSLNIVKGYGVTEGFLSQHPIRYGEGITGSVVQNGEPYSTADIRHEPQVKNSDVAELEGIRSVLCVPMNNRDSTIGCVTVYRKRNQPFGDHDLLLLSIFASEAVEAIEKARLINELQRQATYDPLTGLLNKRALQEKLQQEMSRSQRHGHKMALMFIDLDGFKHFNDHHGHLMGDKLLHDFTGILKSHCRKIDLIGRFGGDEFVIIAPQTDADGALTVANKILRALTDHTFQGKEAGTPYHTSCSIGLAVTPDHGSNCESLLEKADEALYTSKKQGKGCVTLWTESIQ